MSQFTTREPFLTNFFVSKEPNNGWLTSLGQGFAYHTLLESAIRATQRLESVMVRHENGSSPSPGGRARLRTRGSSGRQTGSGQNVGIYHQAGTRRSGRLQQDNQSGQGANNQQLQKLRSTLEDYEKEIKALKDANAWYEKKHEKQLNKIEAYRITIEDKCTESCGLRQRVVELEEQVASASQGSVWPFNSLLPRAKDTQNTKNDEIAKLQATIAGYEDGIQTLQVENRDLKQTVRQQTNQIQMNVAGFAQELADLKNRITVETPKVSDTEIQIQWQALGTSIRQFVLRYLRGPLDLPTMQEVAKLEMFSWLPETARTLQVPLLRPIILESWVWHFLCIRAFDAQSELWAGRFGNAFSVPCGEVRDYLTRGVVHSTSPASNIIEQFHDWRVRSAHFIFHLGAHDRDSSVRGVAHAMVKTFGFFLPSTVSDGQLENMRMDTLGIVQKAAELDKIFRLSKADFQVFITRVKLPLASPPSYGFEFDPETMECIETIPIPGAGESLPTVDLAVSPGIFKAGTADGVNYDTERVLVKLQALCNLQEILTFFENSQVDGFRESPEVEVGNGYVKPELAGTDDEVDFVTIKPEPEE